jgi:hypothetical protein
MLMKKLLKEWVKIMAVILLAIILIPEKLNAQGVSISFQTFYDELSPYGQWIDDPEYGYVWVPDAEADFQPYATRGHWAVTQYGNTWVSDYPWGWAPFHYGRWTYNNYYGWQWIPGTEWGPAWVSWRNGGGYYGWAPLGPGVSVNISFGSGYHVPHNHWVFVPQRYICEPYIGRYFVPRRRNVTIINHTTIINNTYVNNNRTYITGPRPREIQRVTRNRVNIYNINNETRPGRTVVNNRSVNIYRPEVSAARGKTEVPAQVVRNNNRPVRDAGNASVNQPEANLNDRSSNRQPSNTAADKTPERSSRPAREVSRPDYSTNPSAESSRERPAVRNQDLPRNTNTERAERPARAVEKTERDPVVQTERVRQQPAPASRQKAEAPAQRPQTQQAPARQVQPQRAPQTAQPRTERPASRSGESAAPSRSSNSRPSR